MIIRVQKDVAISVNGTGPNPKGNGRIRNCIVLDIKAKNPVLANITEIAKLIDASRQPTSTVINSLVKKGILFKGDSGVEGNNAKAYAAFINPHVVYAGDKDNVNEALKVMFYKAMKMPILKDLPNKFF